MLLIYKALFLSISTFETPLPLYPRLKHHPPGTRRMGGLLGLLVPLFLAGCTSWTHPTKPASAFPDEAATCKREAAQAAIAAGQFGLYEDTVYRTCLRHKGWELR